MMVGSTAPNRHSSDGGVYFSDVTRVGNRSRSEDTRVADCNLNRKFQQKSRDLNLDKATGSIFKQIKDLRVSDGCDRPCFTVSFIQFIPELRLECI